jgi:hypothetical protein
MSLKEAFPRKSIHSSSSSTSSSSLVLTYIHSLSDKVLFSFNLSHFHGIYNTQIISAFHLISQEGCLSLTTSILFLLTQLLFLTLYPIFFPDNKSADSQISLNNLCYMLYCECVFLLSLSTNATMTQISALSFSLLFSFYILYTFFFFACRHRGHLTQAHCLLKAFYIVHSEKDKEESTEQ